MSNTNKSASATTRALRNKALATFYSQNPGAHETRTNTTFGVALHTARVAGQTLTDCCACDPGTITNFVSSDLIAPCPPPYDPEYNIYFDLTWDSLSGATSYTVTSDFVTDLVVSTGVTTASIYLRADGDYGSTRTFTLTANTPCGDTSATTTGAPCFLAGSLVEMADGTEKVIENVKVGDLVLGAFGEINAVLALHRPLLGTALMCKINDEHSTTNHHPHISVDRKFYCGNPGLVNNATYGRVHKVIDADGNSVDRMLHGLNKERIQKLCVGINLKTVEGSRTTRTLETYSMPEDTQLYNLVVSGSHTYHVDGYAVTGWPREDDFDYDTWTQSGMV